MAKKRKNKRSFFNMHLTSTVSMSLVLFLLGLVSLLFFLAHDLSVQVRENISLSLILNEKATDAEIKRIENYLNKSNYTKSVEYISKDDALKEYIASLGEDPADFLGYNPLLASIEVKLKSDYANNDSIANIESKLKAFEQIDRMSYQKDMMSLVTENVRKIGIVLVALAAVLLFISMALINNTIRLSIYSDRFLINTMKLVGANPWFIRKPYIKHSMLSGFFASILALMLLVGIVYLLKIRFGIDVDMVKPLIIGGVSTIVVTLGIFLTAISAYVAVGRYVKMNTNDMYFV